MEGEVIVIVWKKCLEQIKEKVPLKTFETWFKPLVFLNFSNGVLRVEVPSKIFFEYFDEQHGLFFKHCFEEILGEKIKSLKYDTSQSNKDTEKKTAPKTTFTPVLPSFDCNLHREYYFENFVEAAFNKYARSVALGIVKSTSKMYNPFFLFGKVGVGKTHLSNAIGNEILKRQPQKRVLYVSAREFQDQYANAAVKNKNLPDFLNFYQHLDVLIIDDIQFLSGKIKTQEVFYEIFNVLHRKQKQIIIVADVPPSNIEGITDRLISRFAWGITVSIDAPDLKARTKIIKYKIEKENLVISNDVIKYVAEKVKSIRILEGVIVDMIARWRLQDAVFDIKLAKQAIERRVKHVENKIDISFVISAVCGYFELSEEEIQSKRRTHNVSQARQIAMYFAKKYTKMTLSDIGKGIGKRNYATVKYSIGAVENLQKTDKSFASDLKKIDLILKN